MVSNANIEMLKNVNTTDECVCVCVCMVNSLQYLFKPSYCNKHGRTKYNIRPTD